jgi:hypothetical protein
MYYLNDGKTEGSYREKFGNLKYVIKCPNCYSQIIVDQDQAYGRVSVQCSCGLNQKIKAA